MISGNGRHVAFQSFGRLGPKDLDRKEDVYVRDIRKGATTHVSLLLGSGKDVRESVLVGDISDNGNVITFGNDNMLWVRDMTTHATRRFHNEPDAPPCQPHLAGSAGRPAISGNGKFVAFASCAVDLPGEDHTSKYVYRLTLATAAFCMPRWLDCQSDYQAPALPTACPGPAYAPTGRSGAGTTLR